MAYKFADSCLNSTTTTGTGTLTLGSAVTGFQSISAIGDGNSATFAAFEVDANGNRDGDWETFVGTFTSSGTTLSRDVILASSNSGSAVSWAAGTKYVALISADSTVAMPLNQICNGRLTLTTGTPVTTSDVTASTSVYFTPFRGNRIALYNGYSWQILTFSELSLSTTSLTAAKPYDVFAYISSGAVAIEALVWTNDTTRATGLTTQDGVYVKSGDATRRYLGSFYTFDNSGTVSARDTQGGASAAPYRHVWNFYNQVPRFMDRWDATGHSYASSTIRQWNADTKNQFNVLVGLPTTINVSAHSGVRVDTSGTYPFLYLQQDSTSSGSDNIYLFNNGTTDLRLAIAAQFSVAAGAHYIAALEQATSGTGGYGYLKMTGSILA